MASNYHGFYAYSLKWYIIFYPNVRGLSRFGACNSFLNLADSNNDHLIYIIQFELWFVETAKICTLQHRYNTRSTCQEEIEWPIKTKDLYGN